MIQSPSLEISCGQIHRQIDRQTYASENIIHLIPPLTGEICVSGAVLIQNEYIFSQMQMFLIKRSDSQNIIIFFCLVRPRLKFFFSCVYKNIIKKGPPDKKDFLLSLTFS